MVQMYLGESCFTWLQTTLVWVTECLVEHGFASHPSPALTIIQCHCQIFPLSSCSEHFIFHMRVKKPQRDQCLQPMQNDSIPTPSRDKEDQEPQGLAVSPYPASQALGTHKNPKKKKKKKEKVSAATSRPVRSEKVEREREGAEIVLRNRKSLKAAVQLIHQVLWGYLCSSI